jgi:hypothetical protein
MEKALANRTAASRPMTTPAFPTSPPRRLVEVPRDAWPTELKKAGGDGSGLERQPEQYCGRDLLPAGWLTRAAGLSVHPETQTSAPRGARYVNPRITSGGWPAAGSGDRDPPTWAGVRFLSRDKSRSCRSTGFSAAMDSLPRLSLCNRPDGRSQPRRRSAGTGSLPAGQGFPRGFLLVRLATGAAALATMLQTQIATYTTLHRI